MYDNKTNKDSVSMLNNITDNSEKDAFDVMFEMIDGNPDITTSEIAERLVEGGYAKSKESVGRFFVAIGIEES